ncbi:hypothetical protein FHR83_001460 [Actinoplanes campanulatus]|uniref:CopC domain-containing protein n=1 Tax=Actinoplanes campanulatus TaxID=113559 RepID=A0A7W5ACL8_9ACTN|nr:copper resistance CopC family protein [Actinoplanes campanulatus]MBB3093811.1 hypothetical protein [Actinoplanes campanulatus]GGN05854.1 hypothetical protein GCM10010109_13330 [Actinoplanes campanulatus]GID35111.1 hypothetical protein Aca09nite_16170 [Actinoplanes campanulatus]
MSTVTTRVRLRPLLVLAALLLVLVPGTPAWAHNALAEASPAKGATLKESPAEVRLRFLQKLDPDHTTITVSDAGGAKMATSAPKVNGATGTVTVGEPLANGVYTVAYQVVSTDGHPVKGSYEFTVDDPAPPVSAAPSEAAPAPTASATTTSAASPPLLAAEESSNTAVYGLVAGIAVALAAVATFLFIRRRKA